MQLEIMWKEKDEVKDNGVGRYVLVICKSYVLQTTHVK